MSAKPLNIAGATALPTHSPKPAWPRDGGTASTKRTQGIVQAARRFAPSPGLIQPRKQGSARADRVTLPGRRHPDARDGKLVLASSGSIKIVARTKRSVLDRSTASGLGKWVYLELGRPPTNPGGRESGGRENRYQPKEGVSSWREESDPCIVVRDGRADHMAKARAGGQRRPIAPIPEKECLQRKVSQAPWLH